MKLKLNSNVDILNQRAEFLRFIREFFFEKGYSEVDTPLIAKHPACEPNIDSVVSYPFSKDVAAFLVTSPEYFMKRILIKNRQQPIYQLNKSFRKGELSDQHSPEFLMLEWYHPNWSYTQILSEAAEFIKKALELPEHDLCCYQEAFIKTINIDPLNFDDNSFHQFLSGKIQETAELERLMTMSYEDKCDYLMAFFVQPKLGLSKPLFVYDFPISEAALAMTNDDNKTAKRFECFYKGIELCNGFEELRTYQDHKRQFTKVQQQKALKGEDDFPIDTDFLEELKTPLPEVSGVALGVDRLLALKLNKHSIAEVCSFYWQD